MLRSIGGILGKLLLLGLCFFLGLAMLYRYAPPPSTLMLARWTTMRPVNQQWVPLSAISPHLIRAVITSEDAKFCTHNGVDWEQLQKVVERADEDGPSRGASTITMQLARNLFLWQGRSYIRKALEIPMAMALELLWPKRRILEVYLNVAEWGDGIFGAEVAAKKYYHHAAATITPYEAQLMAMSLPNPMKRRAGNPGAGLQALASDLSERIATEGTNTSCLRR